MHFIPQYPTQINDHRSQSHGAGVHSEVAIPSPGKASGQLMQRKMGGSVGQLACVFHSGHSQQLGLGVTCTTTGAAKQQRPTSFWDEVRWWRW